MIRTILIVAALSIAANGAALAQSSKAKAAAKEKAEKAAAAKAGAKPAPPGGGKPVLVASFGSWGAYQSQAGKSKVCYALAQPQERQPAKLKRDPAYVFISTRPGEGVRGEISIIMGFPLKEGAAGATAEVGATSFELIAKGTNAWLKNPAQEAQFADAMRKGSRLVVKAPSAKNNVTTDIYSLAGIGQALERVQKDCP